MPRPGTPGHRRGCAGHRTRSRDQRPPIGATWSASRVPAARPLRGRATERRYSPATSRRCVHAAISLDPFAMRPAFPASDYYGSSAPSRRHQPTTGLPAHRPEDRWVRGRRDGSHVHCMTACPGRRPAMPLPLRHDYAADVIAGTFSSHQDRNLVSRPPSNPAWLTLRHAESDCVRPLGGLNGWRMRLTRWDMQSSATRRRLDT